MLNYPLKADDDLDVSLPAPKVPKADNGCRLGIASVWVFVTTLWPSLIASCWICLWWATGGVSRLIAIAAFVLAIFVFSIMSLIGAGLGLAGLSLTGVGRDRNFWPALGAALNSIMFGVVILCFLAGLAYCRSR
jgi:hypothetical protein